MGDSTADLQFERAEPAGQNTPKDVRCAACQTQLSSYFEVNGNVACDTCKDTVVARHHASHAPTLIRGASLGAVAAAVGAGIYYAIAKVTGYEFGLMSIVLGLMVGFAVRRGSGARGGWRYQALAMFLCYAAICATYVPRIISAAQEQNAQTVAASGAAKPAAAPANATAKLLPTASATPVASPRTEPPPKLGSLLKAAGMLFAFALALPFLAGFQNLMGLVIIAIGLYEAWKVNRSTPFSVSGPFMVGEARGG
jgi:hypothetical protein